MRDLLNNLFIFKDLDFHSLDLKYNICEKSIKVSYNPEETILSAYTDNIGIGIVTEGEAYIVSSTRENSPILRTLKRGAIFGAASLFDASSGYTTYVRAKTQCTVAYIKSAGIRKLCYEVPEIAINYIEFLSGRITFLNKKLSAFTAENADAKLAYYLYELSDGKADEIKVSVTYSQLAENLGIGRASLYRSLDTLTDNGIVKKNAKTITILQPDKLKLMIK